jgi:hypothetical protein
MKICLDCKFIKGIADDGKLEIHYRCTNKKVYQNPVNGSYGVSAQTARGSNKLCGIEAKYFEEIE